MPAMRVSQGEIIRRGLRNCCPNCGGDTLFKAGKWFEIDDSCRACGMKIEKDDGFFLGAMSLNYGVVVFGWLAPVALLWYAGVFGPRVAVGLALGGAVVLPIAFYRSSRSWQLMSYYFFLPQHLPANRRPLGTEDENV